MAKPVEKMTVKELKVELKARGLSLTGVKSILLSRLQEAIAEAEAPEAAVEEDTPMVEPEAEEAATEEPPAEEEPAPAAAEEEPAEEEPPEAEPMEVDAPAQEERVGGKRTRGDDDAPPLKKARAEEEPQQVVFKPAAAPAAPAEPARAPTPLPKDATNAVLVEGLRRPFTLGEIKELLSESGPLEHFWISKNRSRCCAVYAENAAAAAAFQAIDGITWPPKIGSSLRVKFISEREARDAKDEPAAVPAPAKRAQSPPARAVEAASPKDAPSQPTKSLDELFNKTKTEPCIYWKPVDEDETKANWENLMYDGKYNARTSSFPKYPNKVR
eukprot:CAMPEP_0114629744 /NCGR_PEP_ID=MMETSP0168-20121206/13522_1 /TAXON_ID=95228 ORGANISM="Vannella sp., Strain DIVA3 517/6/12" /NCGR_SAMPLE_ID=MMETSP0168 /ASSEMBLY_ACC=CAM_ASM_000044 /LENGTH=328 /DNA_ID=CAMNT_0001841223 /DNA_START=21 /DNA_END=1007 /DNA_ORIENTATION=-